ncbi:hypothetical protein CK203_057201 [Vitis vinifera]|uniref:Ubiquitin-like protease family profile domain-containing protein n=1 Tax=Vitis vinifera TaxID=29760 RepID=A0A438GL04_VITVI|nr:hypothetical protein CK203_057201 [Vitis vinifera]
MSPPRRDKEQMDGNEGKQKIASPKRKERRAKYVYIHRVSRKGYAGLQEELMQRQFKETIDRWVLWKLARLKKGEYDDVTRPVAEKIVNDELAKAVEEGKITCVGQKDILTLALGTSEHLGRVRGKGGKKKPKQFFNTPKPTKTLEEEECQRMLREKVKSLEEEIISLKAEKKEPLTPHSEVSSTNIRKQLLEHEEIRGKTHYSAHVENLSAEGTRKASPLTQVYKCKLALETKENIVAYGTYLRDSKISIDGTDILVVILYPLQPNALLRFPLSENISTIRKGVGYEVLWHVAFVINDENDEDFGKRKNKMKKIQASPKKIKYENPRDIQLFSKTVLAMLEGLVSKAGTIAPQIEKRARIIADRLIDSKLADLIFLPYNPRFHWVLAVIDLKSQTIYYLDSLLQQPYQDIKDIVNM